MSFICRWLNLSKENPSKPHFLSICGLVIFWLLFFGLSPHFLVIKNMRVQIVFAFPMWYTAWKVSKYGVFSSPYFPVFGLNTEIYSVNLRIQSKYRKIGTRNNSVFVCDLNSRSVCSNIALLNSSTRKSITAVKYKCMIYHFFVCHVCFSIVLQRKFC